MLPLPLASNGRQLNTHVVAELWPENSILSACLKTAHLQHACTHLPLPWGGKLHRLHVPPFHPSRSRSCHLCPACAQTILAPCLSAKLAAASQGRYTEGNRSGTGQGKTTMKEEWRGCTQPFLPLLQASPHNGKFRSSGRVWARRASQACQLTQHAQQAAHMVICQRMPRGPHAPLRHAFAPHPQRSPPQLQNSFAASITAAAAAAVVVGAGRCRGALRRASQPQDTTWQAGRP